MKKPSGLAAFNAAHNPDVTVPATIAAALAAMVAEKGIDAWEYEGDFRKRTRLQPSALSDYRDRFSAHQIYVPDPAARGGKRRVWIGNAKKVAEFLKTPGASRAEG